MTTSSSNLADNLAIEPTDHATWANRPARMGEDDPRYDLSQSDDSPDTSRLSSDPAYLSGSALDAYIAGSLATAYSLSEHLSPFKLRVDVKDAVVTLGGVVEDKVLRNLAIVIAHDLCLVRDVKSEIAVGPPAPRSILDEDFFLRRFNDATLTARVKTRLLWNGPTRGCAINVSAINDVVTLSGAVASEQVRELAGRVALDVKGVLRIENTLQVDGMQPA